MKLEIIDNHPALPPVDEERLERVSREKTIAYRREWEERYSGLLAGRRHWKVFAAGLLLINGGLAAGLWNVARMSHTELYVLDRSGSRVNYAGPVKPTNMDDATWDLVRVEQLKKFISSWRTVTTDVSAQNADWDRTFYFVGENSQAKKVLTDWYQQNDPLKRGAKGESVVVNFLTYDKEGANTYRIWWTETSASSGSPITQTTSWQARIVYATKIPSDPKARAENSLGILATELAWQSVDEK
jgi:type IV secretory pathway TrbF-like protein